MICPAGFNKGFQRNRLGVQKQPIQIESNSPDTIHDNDSIH
jgi:hypothetical protein